MLALSDNVVFRVASVSDEVRPSSVTDKRRAAGERRKMGDWNGSLGGEPGHVCVLCHAGCYHSNCSITFLLSNINVQAAIGVLLLPLHSAIYLLTA